MPLSAYLLLASALFCVGVYGLLSRRNAIGILLSVELMANAANINLVAFAHFRGGYAGQVFAIFAIALAVTEVVVGLALIILLYRAKKDVQVDAVHALGN